MEIPRSEEIAPQTTGRSPAPGTKTGKGAASPQIPGLPGCTLFRVAASECSWGEIRSLDLPVCPFCCKGLSQNSARKPTAAKVSFKSRPTSNLRSGAHSPGLTRHSGVPPDDVPKSGPRHQNRKRSGLPPDSWSHWLHLTTALCNETGTQGGHQNGSRPTSILKLRL